METEQGTPVPDDAALLAEALADPSSEADETPKQAEQEPAPQAEEGKREPTQPEATQPAPDADKQHVRVPLAELLSEREKRQRSEQEAERLRLQFEAMQRDFQARQQAQPAPDPYADPQGHTVHTMRPFMEQVHGAIQAIAKDTATAIHGREKVDEAERAFIGAVQSGAIDPGTYQRVVNAPNRFTAALEWHQERQVLSEVGRDPKAYAERIRKEAQDAALKDPDFLKRAYEAIRASGSPVIAPATPTNPRPLPSLSSVGTAAGAAAPIQDMSDKELFRDAMKRR